MHFRKMREKDLPAIIEITRANMSPILRASWNKEWTKEPFLQGLDAASSRTKVLIHRGELIGYVTYLLQPRRRSIFIWSMMVKHEYQRRGIGQRFMERLEKEARGRNYSALELNVQSANKIAYRFYKQCGFRVAEVIGIPGGKPDLHMRKPLTVIPHRNGGPPPEQI